MRGLLILLYPLLELYLLIKAGQLVGAGYMVLWTVLSALLGIFVMQQRGESVTGRIKQSLAEGKVPQVALLNEFFIFFAGLLLLLPGVLTDIAGLLLLLPPVRALAGFGIARWASSPSAETGTRFFFYQSGTPPQMQENGEAPRRTVLLNEPRENPFSPPRGEEDVVIDVEPVEPAGVKKEDAPDAESAGRPSPEPSDNTEKP